MHFMPFMPNPTAWFGGLLGYLMSIPLFQTIWDLLMGLIPTNLQ